VHQVIYPVIHAEKKIAVEIRFNSEISLLIIGKWATNILIVDHFSLRSEFLLFEHFSLLNSLAFTARLT